MILIASSQRSSSNGDGDAGRLISEKTKKKNMKKEKPEGGLKCLNMICAMRYTVLLKTAQ